MTLNPRPLPVSKAGCGCENLNFSSLLGPVCRFAFVRRRQVRYCAVTLPWKSRLTLTLFPSFMAFPRHTPCSSFLSSLTLA
jgi:hypothetical protein